MTCLSDLIYRLEQSGADSLTACAVVSEAYTAGVQSTLYRDDLVGRVLTGRLHNSLSQSDAASRAERTSVVFVPPAVGEA